MDASSAGCRPPHTAHGCMCDSPPLPGLPVHNAFNVAAVDETQSRLAVALTAVLQITVQRSPRRSRSCFHTTLIRSSNYGTAASAGTAAGGTAAGGRGTGGPTGLAGAGGTGGCCPPGGKP